MSRRSRTCNGDVPRPSAEERAQLQAAAYIPAVQVTVEEPGVKGVPGSNRINHFDLEGRLRVNLRSGDHHGAFRP